MSELLKINNLTVAFKGERGENEAVKNVSLSLREGETLALVGESGCGKTVLCKSMLKILCEKGSIKEGEILLNGQDLTMLDEKEMVKHRGKDIAMVFQDPMLSLDPAFSVGSQIAEVLRLHEGCTHREAAEKAAELMETVQIPNARARYSQRPYQFSGGMRQRIAIAAALAAKPRLLLADEPTTALDEATQRRILHLLKKLQRETGVAILFITHDLSVAAEMAQRVAVMKDGKIVETGKTGEVLSNPKHEYTKRLLTYLGYVTDSGHNHRSVPAPADGKPLLEVRNLSKSYMLGRKKRQSVINDINLSVFEGEIVGLVGKSGCGKSTLARCITGLEKHDGGEIIIKNGTKMQMIFQDSQSYFNERMTVEQIIKEPLRIEKKRGFAGKKEKKKYSREAAEVMKAVGLPENTAERHPYELSGGQRQRVAIARALITEPDLIIADEPLTGLDVSSQAQIVHLMKELSVQRGLAVLFIAHDMPMVNHVSSRVIKLEKQ